MACNCGSTQTPCESVGCLVQLDFECSLYNKDNSEVSKLTNLGLTNGSSLKLFAEAVDVQIGQLKVSTFTLPFLKSAATINTLKQFAEAVDTRLQGLTTGLTAWLGNVATDPVSPIDGNYWYNVTSNELKIKVNGLVKKIPIV